MIEVSQIILSKLPKKMIEVSQIILSKLPKKWLKLVK